MFDHEFLELIPLYAVGSLGAPEKRKLEAHLEEGCDICEPELLIFSETASRLVYALPDHPLPTALKEKIRGRLDRENLLVAPAAPSSGWGTRLAFAAALAGIVLMAGLLWRTNEKLVDQRAQIAQIQKQLTDQSKEIAWLRDPSVQLALLSGLESAPQAKGKMVWNPTELKGIFYANFLPQLPPEKSYQLWVIGSHGPVSAGVFDTQSNGSAVITISHVQISAAGGVQFAVTIEPRGGRPQPTGSMVLKGTPI